MNYLKEKPRALKKLKMTHPKKRLRPQYIIVDQDPRLKSYLVREIILKPFRILHKTGILRDPKFCRPVFGCEVQQTYRTCSCYHNTADYVSPRVFGYCDTPSKTTNEIRFSFNLLLCPDLNIHMILR